MYYLAIIRISIITVQVLIPIYIFLCKWLYASLRELSENQNWVPEPVTLT